MAEILNIKTPDELGNDILVRQPLEGGVLRLVLNNPPANTLSEAMLTALQEEGKPLPSLHSPFWAPDAEAVVRTSAEALASSALDLMPAKGG